MAALDDWAYAAWRSGKLEEMKHLLAVARAAAPDPVGDRLRRFETFTQPGEFDKIFKELTPTALSPQLLILVSKLIPEGHADREAWARKAQRKYPNDFWLNLYLADVMEKAHPADAIGYLRAAIAVRPTTSRPISTWVGPWKETGVRSKPSRSSNRPSPATQCRADCNTSWPRPLRGRAA